MKQTLEQLIKDYPQPFAEWPESAQNQLVNIARHYCNRDEMRFAELRVMLRRWAIEDEGKLPSADLIGITPLT